ELSPASDIYSLGATLYYLLTGAEPFAATERDVLAVLIENGQFPPPRERQPLVHPALEAVCLKAMALEPAKRYTTTADLRADVERWLADEAVLARVEPWPARLERWARHHRGAVTVTAVLGILFAAVIVGSVLTVQR